MLASALQVRLAYLYSSTSKYSTKKNVNPLPSGSSDRKFSPKRRLSVVKMRHRRKFFFRHVALLLYQEPAQTSQQWRLDHVSISPAKVIALTLLCLVVSKISGTATECTTIRHLFGHASLATVGCEAPKTIYPHLGGVVLTRVKRRKLLAERRWRG